MKEKEILEEIVKKCKIKKGDEVLIKVLINICKYYILNTTICAYSSAG